ncbi:hypothetical protein DKT75_11135 [Leucothrix arctica]|uniref:AB hydrolase-1 domain-containing protein n=2 Tax=Leucothrix arctica TaxID=1481894 RepID=A0A317CBJ1_9GAMM|nr:hypothetical protein DKT75_11135 [Leucothrix arctica]
MDASSWDSLSPFIANKIPFQALNLPGYAGVPELPNMSMDNVVDWLAEQFDGKCHLLGWSMGGLVAQAFTKKYPEKIVSLTMVGSTPCFTKKTSWPNALEPEILTKFVENLQDNKSTTLRRFIALQFMGESAAAGIQKQLRKAVTKQVTSLSTLALGLSWLRNCDYRESRSLLTTAQHWMFGELDQLVPVAVGAALQNAFPDIMVSYFEGCGHAPQLTQPERFAEKLLYFISQHTSK